MHRVQDLIVHVHPSVDVRISELLWIPGEASFLAPTAPRSLQQMACHGNQTASQVLRVILLAQNPPEGPTAKGQLLRGAQPRRTRTGSAGDLRLLVSGPRANV